MPLLALGQTIPRGYQYQSQMTPYRRDARGDWGRALNESIDQFIGMYPQWLQQKRAFALQREQLARQRTADAHQAKLRPFELKQAEANQKLLEQKMQMRENYPQMVKGLPIDDKMKAYLLTQSPEQGNALIKTYLEHQFKPRTKVLQADDPNNPFPGVPVNVSPEGKTTVIKVPRKKVWVQPKELIPGGGGAVNNTPNPIQVDPLTGTVSTGLGLTAQKKIVPLSIHDKRRDVYPEWQQDSLQLDMTYGGEGQVIVPDSAKTAPKNLVPVPKNDERLKNYYPDEHAHLKLDKNNDQIVIDPGFRLHEKIINVPAGGLYPDGKTKNNLKVPVQVNRSGAVTTPEGKAPQEQFVPVPVGDKRLPDYPVALQKFLRVNLKNNEISFPPSFTKDMQKLALKEGRPSATQRFKNWQEVPGNEAKSFSDLDPWTGTTMESKYWFATQNLPANHPLHIDAQNQLNLKHIKVTPNAVVIGRGYKDPNNPQAGQRLPVPTTRKIKTGDSVSGLAKKFGTTESQIIAANPDWFEKDMNGKANVLSMRTSDQMEGAEMIIPTGKSTLSQSQINEAHSSRRRARVSEMPYGTIIPIQTATVGDGLRLNTERLDMQNIQKSVKDFVELMQNPKARGFGKIGEKEKGELEGIRQRLINNVQVLRDYGVLSPSEIVNIERSVPPVNSIIALMTRGLGSDEFVVGAMNKLYEEAVNNERKLDALLKLYGSPVIDYERYSGGIPGYDATSGGSEIEILDNELSSFE